MWLLYQDCRAAWNYGLNLATRSLSVGLLCVWHTHRQNTITHKRNELERGNLIYGLYSYIVYLYIKFWSKSVSRKSETRHRHHVSEHDNAKTTWDIGIWNSVYGPYTKIVDLYEIRTKSVNLTCVCASVCVCVCQQGNFKTQQARNIKFSIFRTKCFFTVLCRKRQTNRFL